MHQQAVCPKVRNYSETLHCQPTIALENRERLHIDFKAQHTQLFVKSLRT